MAQALVKLDRSTSMPQHLLVMYAICTILIFIRVSSRENMSGISDQVRENSDCATTESTWTLEILDREIFG